MSNSYNRRRRDRAVIAYRAAHQAREKEQRLRRVQRFQESSGIETEWEAQSGWGISRGAQNGGQALPAASIAAHGEDTGLQATPQAIPHPRRKQQKGRA